MGGRMLFKLSLASSTHCTSVPVLLRPPCFVGHRVQAGFRALCSSAVAVDKPPEQSREIALLEKLRSRYFKKARNVAKLPSNRTTGPQKDTKSPTVSSFAEMELAPETMSAIKALNISVPTEVQCLGIPAILGGQSIVLASHTGSGKTLAYMLPLVQLLRKDEGDIGMQTKPKRPRAVVLCPTRELSEQVFRVAKSISHYARFRSTLIGGGGPLKPQEDALNTPLEMVVGTPGRLLQHVTQGNIFYGDIKYVVLDEADTMFDRGFGPDLRKFLNPLRKRAAKSGDQGFQAVLVSATITKAVQKLLDEEFQGIVHIRTSTLHKKIASAHHDFVKLSGSENKLEALLQVLEPSLAKGNRVMVFCNTLDSSRAVDHFLNDNQLLTVNYHGEVPAEKRVENLNKFKSDDGDCPTLVCTDLAARGLDLAVDHVIMFDFPLTPVDYLHRTGRTARMGAKGKVTSLVTKKDIILASLIEEALRKNESLEELTTNKETYEAMKQKQIQKKRMENAKPLERSSAKGIKSRRTGRTLISKLGSKGLTNSVPRKYRSISTTQKGKVVKVSLAGSKEKKALIPQKLGGKPKVQRTGRPSIVNSSSKQTNGQKMVKGRAKVSKTEQALKTGQPSIVNSRSNQTNGQKRVKGRTKVWKTEQALTSRLSVVGFKGKQTSGRKNGKGAVKINS